MAATFHMGSWPQLTRGGRMREGLARGSLIVALGLAQPAAQLSAQAYEADSARIRLTLRPDRRSAIGVLVWVTPDSIRLLTRPGGEAAFSRADVIVAERSLGRKGSSRTGALVGLGLTLGAVIVETVRSPYGSDVSFGVGLFSLALIGGVGAAAGATVGGLITSERWQATSFAGQSTLGPPSLGRSLVLGRVWF